MHRKADACQGRHVMFVTKMRPISILRVLGLILLAALLFGCSPALEGALRVLKSPDTTVSSQPPQPAPPETGREAAFRQGLEAGGYTVNRGSTVVVYPTQLVDQKQIDSAAGFNSGQPYKRFQVPALGAELPDKDVHSVGIFKLQPDEALVFVGPTPPQADYFSYAIFLWVRHLDSLIPKGDWIYPTIGVPLNNAVIKHEGEGEPFGQQTMVIWTADEGVYSSVASIAAAAGYPESMINVVPIPSSLVHMGLGPKSDSLLLLVRTGNLAQGDATDQYMANNYYGTVYRVTPKTAPELQPYPAVPPPDRNWKHEADLVPDLEGGLDRLQAAILAQNPNPSAKAYGSARWFYDSWDVLQDDPASPAYRKFDAGESADTPYLRTVDAAGAPVNFLLGEHDSAIVFGVNHAQTGLSTYSAFAAYGDYPVSSCDTPEAQAEFEFGCGDLLWNGVAGMTNHGFAGSAEAYLPGDPVAPYLYAVKVVRGACPAGDKYCVSVPEPSTPGSSDGIPLDKPLMFGYRAYLNPETKIGPSYEDILPDRAIFLPGQ